VETVALCGFAFIAGLVDSVVGGGGLIQLPALLLLLPHGAAPHIAAVFGTAKMSGVCGISMAVFQYSRRVRIHWRLMLPAGAAALVFSFLGARVVSLINGEALKPVIFFLMVAVAIYTYWRKDFGNLHAPHLEPRKAMLLSVAVGAGIGFYDGFFGPGSGSFLIFIFIGLFGFDFLNASASAKFINLCANLSAIAYFAATDNILYRYAIPMGVCSLLGSVAGTHMAILKGNAFVRIFFLCVVSVMILRFGWEIFGK
jgi:uncharacterized membrane protein YfcA